jgi:hypothetical protein
MRDRWERLYEKALQYSNRPMTGSDLARMMDEAKREADQTVSANLPSPYDLEAVAAHRRKKDR